MEITEVRVFLKEGPDKKLKAYATLTFDNCFVVRNVKVIQGTKGLFVAMPSRKIREACPKCHYKNTARSRYCSQCGSALPQQPQQQNAAVARQAEHRDIAHPITLECREMIQRKVLEAYDAEAAKEPKARARFEDEDSPVAEENFDEIEGRDIAL
ncbi:MAG: septation protein SpoVG family protein [Candidatus Omnitrophota bacterium]